MTDFGTLIRKGESLKWQTKDNLSYGKSFKSRTENGVGGTEQGGKTR